MTSLAATASKVLATTIRSLQKELAEGFGSLGEVSVLFTWEGQDYQVILRHYLEKSPGPKRAKKKDSPNPRPLPGAREHLRIDWHFRPGEYERMKLGFIPQGMDDKWFIYFDGRSKEFRFYRSRTGFCIFVLRVQEDGDGCKVIEAWANRDPEQYDTSDPHHDPEVVRWLIEVLLLGAEREFPSRAD